MGLREKAILFKEQEQIKDTVLDHIPGPADLPVLEDNNNEPENEKIFQDSFSEDLEIQDDLAKLPQEIENIQEPRTLNPVTVDSPWRIIHEISMITSRASLFDLILMHFSQDEHIKKAALWVMENGIARLQATKGYGEFRKAIELSEEILQFLLFQSPMLGVSDHTFFADHPLAPEQSINYIIPLHIHNQIIGFIGLEEKPNHSWEELQAQVHLISQHVYRVLYPTEQYTDLNQPVVEFLNQMLQESKQVTIAQFTVKNFTRIINITSNEEAQQLMDYARQFFLEELNSDCKIFRINPKSFLVISQSMSEDNLQGKLSLLKYKMQQIELSRDLIPVIFYRFFHLNEDFDSTLELFSLL